MTPPKIGGREAVGVSSSAGRLRPDKAGPSGAGIGGTIVQNGSLVKL